ncbi:MAG: hypothetical protein IPL01_08580 [Acidobacteria bacterium]|nr:hypothetical protein [Acidobacteriota bacterium]
MEKALLKTLLKLTDFVVKTVFYRQERQEGQERQNGNSMHVLFTRENVKYGAITESPDLFFGVLGPLGVLGDKIPS